MFGFLEKYLGAEYSLISLDLPLHGQSEWPNDLPFTPQDLVQVVEGILSLENSGLTTAQHRSSITLLGFSLGGRLALQLYQAFPERIGKLVLLAPDGLKVNAWYWLATQTFLGQRLFRYTMYHPVWFFGMLRLLNWLRLVNKSIFKFVNFYIGDAKVRSLLYRRWMTLRKIRPSLPAIRASVKELHTPVRLIYGLHDRIILPTRGQRFRQGLEEECQVIIIEAGHQVLHEKHAPQIVDALVH